MSLGACFFLRNVLQYEVMKNKQKTCNIIDPESISTVFIVLFLAILTVAGFLIGFSLPLYLVVMAIVLPIAFLYPRSGIYAAIFLTFIFERFFTLQPIIIARSEYKFYPLDALLLAVICGTLWQMLIHKKKINLRKIDLVVASFSLVAVAYFFFSLQDASSSFALAFSSFKNYVFYSLLYFLLLANIDTGEHLMRLVKFALAGAAGVIFFILYGVINGVGLWTEYTPLSTAGVRILAFTHAFYISMALIGAVAYLIMQNFKKYRLFLPLIFLWIIGIIGSMMRHLWISVFIALMAAYALIPKAQRIYYKKLVSSTLLIVLATVTLLFYSAVLFENSAFGKNSLAIASDVGERFVSIASASDESIFWRNIVWKEALYEYLGRPIAGLGLGKKIFIENNDYRNFVEVRNIHNSFLALFVQMGIAGLGLVLATVVILVKKLSKVDLKNPDLDALRIGILLILIFQLSAFMFQPYLEANLLGIFFWIFLGLARILAYENIRD